MRPRVSAQNSLIGWYDVVGKGVRHGQSFLNSCASGAFSAIFIRQCVRHSRRRRVSSNAFIHSPEHDGRFHRKLDGGGRTVAPHS